MKFQKRKKVPYKKAKKAFTKTASYVSPVNGYTSGPNMRGGIRL